jgi:hypothetical protein
LLIFCDVVAAVIFQVLCHGSDGDEAFHVEVDFIVNLVSVYLAGMFQLIVEVFSFGIDL